MKRLLIAALWIVVGGGLVAFVFGLSFYLAMRRDMQATEVQVPDLGGRTVEEASLLVEPLDLTLQVVDERHDVAVTSGRVLQQMPPPGSTVRRGRKVKLVLSLGGTVLRVPDYVGRPARAVEIELRQQGLGVGDEALVPSYDAPAGIVVAQVPAAGTPVVPSSRVHRLISGGPPAVAWVMPDLAGLSRQQAENWIQLCGFRRGTVRRVRMTGRTAGEVVGQLPLAGYPIRSKGIVELTLAD
ncbi:MAG TPA: PASTA domain-containing protein [Candidatus Polarisedimenticolaceae bacterium]|nr:PASTA domain-containing protein [Candidatus Polarisedimenticolaceae bacterium]